jgi:predicted 3-demethylubiquinone-9 3-methyltransferase (glyoxalase superfamily)
MRTDAQEEVMAKVTTITPCLWFDGRAEEAASFYTSIFPNSKIKQSARYDAEGARASGQPAGSVMTVVFELDGQEFMGLNGGPQFPFSEAVSFIVNCETQREIDHYWDKLTAAGGQEVQCGWLKDQFGVSWQIVPTALGQLLQAKDPEKSRRVMGALLKMKKLDLEALKQAAAA